MQLAGVLAVVILSPTHVGARSFTWLMYCTSWGGCWYAPFYSEQVEVVASAGRLDVFASGHWGALVDGCPECEIDTYEGPAPTPVDEGGGGGGCGDERDNIIQEYLARPDLAALFTPVCSDFDAGGGSTYLTWQQLNQDASEHPPWGIVRARLWYNLDLTRQLYDKDIRIISGYRCPVGNAKIQGARPLSRHQFGDAVDMSPVSPWPDQGEFAALHYAAQSTGPSYLTEWESYSDHHLHADWR